MKGQRELLGHLTLLAKEIFTDKFPNASVMFLAGSIVRGEGTPFSDLDLVIVFDKVSAAYRESFQFQNFPVEAFVHDPETLNYFYYEVDRPSGIPSLAHMVLEGVEIPQPNQLSKLLKERAASFVELGPPQLSEEEVSKRRYYLTGVVDDIRQPRSRSELIAAGAELYEPLADYYFRTNNLWSGKGKSIPRILKQANADLCLSYSVAFDELLVDGQPEKVVALAEQILRPAGGLLFDGYRNDAPPNYRKPLGQA